MVLGLNRTKLCIYILIGIALLQMLSLLQIFDFKPIIAVLGVLMIFFGYNLLTGSFKRMAGAFFCLGAAINIYTMQPLSSWIAGVNYMLNISAILVIMQLFTIPIRLDDYAETMRYLILRTFKSERAIYIFTLLATHVFATFLLFGTMPVMISLFGEPLKKIVADFERFTSTALTRSYAMVVSWAPGAVNILLVVSATGARWIEMLPLSICVTILGLTLAYLMHRRHLSAEPLPQYDDESDHKGDIAGHAYRKIAFICGIAATLIILIVFFDQLDFGDNTSRVMLASLIVAFLWLMSFIGKPGFKDAMDEYLNVSLVKTVDLAVLYVSLGIFSKALEASGILAAFYPYVGIIAEHTGVFILPILSIMVFVLSLMGLHPFIILVVLGKIAVSLNLPYTPEVLSVTLLFGATISYMTSPFAGIVLTAAKFLDITSYQAGIKWNGLYGLVFFLLGTILIMSWGAFM